MPTERRSDLAAGIGALAGATAGCLGRNSAEPSRLDLPVRDDGDAPVDVAGPSRSRASTHTSGESFRKVTYCRRENHRARWTSTRG
ncbi:hypothetical protein B9G49_10910 [Halorubrum sp. SD683]|uniref:Uncharacterized protein n=2 Tax=Halorubrum ezzemoulense TaxID=337243 RepID=A0A256JPV9_HALEZ|nr:hypothetical protein B9H04_04945 [Halorubrum ezzemoulense DSM 17463]OTE99679.1 hypothetical protein B9G49_10910 [Halorubrum sp. SD683]OTF00903.1 hypothetical protein B9G38_15900 [Halorubrum sp. SD612]OYR62602.1 hypothetical protein DJ80_09490 [Halorubrum ezzemoulense]TKX39091.1 hypothetical protein EXE52_11725 [Halorubrum sp. CGM4_25_10-8A]